MTAVAASTPSLWPYLPFLGRGLLVTLEVFALGAFVWLPSGFILAAGRSSRHFPVRLAAGIVIEGFRGSSALVQLFWAFYALPLIGIKLSPIVSAVLVIGLNEGSYTAETVRGAVAAVPRGQREAATVLGLTPLQRARFVVFPQAFVVMLPALANNAIDFLKFTSLVSLVTVSDLTLRATEVRDNTGIIAPVFLTLLVVYYILSVIIAQSFRSLETSVKRRHGLLPKRTSPRMGPTELLRKVRGART